MPAARVITRARDAYSAELRSHSRITSPWNPVSASQFSRRTCQDPNDSGLSWTSCESVLVAASSSQMTGSTKKTTKASSSSPGRTWAAAAGRRARRGWARRAPEAGTRVKVAEVSAGIEESRSGYEHGGHYQRDHEQLDGDRRRVVDVVVLEREVVGELVERVVTTRHPHARLGDQLRLDEQLGADGERQDHHVHNPLAQHRDLDAPCDRHAAGAVDARGLDDFQRDVVQRSVHDHDPAARAGPERDHREQDRQVALLDDLAERTVAEQAQ